MGYGRGLGTRKLAFNGSHERQAVQPFENFVAMRRRGLLDGYRPREKVRLRQGRSCRFADFQHSTTICLRRGWFSAGFSCYVLGL